MSLRLRLETSHMMASAHPWVPARGKDRPPKARARFARKLFPAPPAIGLAVAYFLSGFVERFS